MTQMTNVPNKVGRPSNFDDETIQKLESVFKLGVTVGVACNHAGVSDSAYYVKMKEDEDFRDKMESARDYARIAAGQIVVNAIVKDRDVETAKWWLAKKHPDEFGETHKLSGEYKLIIEDYVSTQ